MAVVPGWDCVDEEAYSFGDPELADGEFLVGVHSSFALQFALHLYHGPLRALPIAGYGNHVHGYSNHISTAVSNTLPTSSARPYTQTTQQDET